MVVEENYFEGKKHAQYSMLVYLDMEIDSSLTITLVEFVMKWMAAAKFFRSPTFTPIY